MSSIKKSRAAISVKPKRAGRGKPFEPGNRWRFPKGVSGNPSGRPKLLGESYAEVLAMEDPATGLTLAQLLARQTIHAAMNGNDAARRELRQATEGDKLHTDEIRVSIDR